MMYLHWNPTPKNPIWPPIEYAIYAKKYANRGLYALLLYFSLLLTSVSLTPNMKCLACWINKEWKAATYNKPLIALFNFSNRYQSYHPERCIHFTLITWCILIGGQYPRSSIWLEAYCVNIRYRSKCIINVLKKYPPEVGHQSWKDVVSLLKSIILGMLKWQNIKELLNP